MNSLRETNLATCTRKVHKPLRRLRRQTAKSFGDCVLLIQELGLVDEETRGDGLGEGVHVNDAGTPCIVMPKSPRRCGVRSAILAAEWCALQTGDAAWVSSHLPHAKNSAGVDRADAILEDPTVTGLQFTVPRLPLIGGGGLRLFLSLSELRSQIACATSQGSPRYHVLVEVTMVFVDREG